MGVKVSQPQYSLPTLYVAALLCALCGLAGLYSCPGLQRDDAELARRTHTGTPAAAMVTVDFPTWHWDVFLDQVLTSSGEVLSCLLQRSWSSTPSAFFISTKVMMHPGSWSPEDFVTLHILLALGWRLIS